MSLTSIIWLLSFLWLTLKGLTTRPVYSFCAYLMTFFAAPQFWWWGNGVISSITMRWNLTAAILLAVVLLIHRRPVLRRRDLWFFFLLATYVLNAFCVHQMFANAPHQSWEEFDLVWKSCGLALLLRMCIRDQSDINIVMMAIVVLSAYISYEVVFNGAGTMEKGRLEGLTFPGAGGSNGTSAILSISFPMIAYFFVINPIRYSRLIAFLSAPFVLDTLLRCNSRGAYLGAAIGGAILVLMARGKSRKYAVAMMLGGILAFNLQAQDEGIWERLFSISAEEGERDHSAQQRIDYWKAAVKMISEHPGRLREDVQRF